MPCMSHDQQTYPRPGADTPLEPGAETPLDQEQTPPGTQVNERVVRILLECILV